MNTDGGFDLIRADAKGRVLVPAAQREALLDAFEGAASQLWPSAASMGSNIPRLQIGSSADGRKRRLTIREAFPHSPRSSWMLRREREMPPRSRNRSGFRWGMESISTLLPGSIFHGWPNCRAIFLPPGHADVLRQPEGVHRGRAVRHEGVLRQPEALAMLTDGIDLKGAKTRPWNESD